MAIFALTSALIAAGSAAAKIGTSVKQNRSLAEQDAIEKRQLAREAEEMRLLTRVQASQRARLFRGVIGTQMVANAGGGIAGGSTTDILEASALLDEQLEAELQDRATRQQIMTKDIRRGLIDRAATARQRQLAIDTGVTLFQTAQTFGSAIDTGATGKPQLKATGDGTSKG